MVIISRDKLHVGCSITQGKPWQLGRIVAILKLVKDKVAASTDKNTCSKDSIESDSKNAKHCQKINEYHYAADVADLSGVTALGFLNIIFFSILRR